MKPVDNSMPEKQITIRKAVSSDILTLQTFIFEHGKNPWNFLPEDEIKMHIAAINTEEVHAYVAEINNNCVGFASFYLGFPAAYQKYEPYSAKNVAYLSEIVVHSDYVSKGIGGKLITTVKEYLIVNNVSRLYAERHADNVSSAGVMTKTGFKIIDEYYDEQRRFSGSRKTVVTRLELL